MIESLLRGDYAASPANLPVVLLGLLLAFLFGQTVAWCICSPMRASPIRVRL
jgi:hypothetical protein